MTATRSSLVFASLVTFSNVSFAETRCQCEHDGWVGDCKANIERQGDWVRVTSDTQQCSRVDWYVNGQPRLTIVTDGAESEQLLNVGPDSTIAIQSCKLCKDAFFSDRRIGETAEQSGNQPASSTNSKRIDLSADWCAKGVVNSWSVSGDGAFRSSHSNGMGDQTGRLTWTSDTEFQISVGPNRSRYRVVDENTLQGIGLFNRSKVTRCGTSSN